MGVPDAALLSPALLMHHISKGRYTIPPHVAYLDDLLIRAVTKPNARIMVNMPPRHAKSETVSVGLPPWYMKRYPEKRVMIATYSDSLSKGFGGRSRDIARMIGLRVKQDSKAKNEWNLIGHEGGMSTTTPAGVATGKGADLLIIDDPHKDYEDAASSRRREKIRTWFDGVAYTRLAPDASIIIVQCMTGDTPVLMADGTERPLRDIRPGDAIATYRDGAPSTSTVERWANQGPDTVLAIRMKSGRVVRANARHPFLVVDTEGVERWTRASSLEPGHALRGIGESGVASPAPSATSPRPRKGFAPRTTTRPGGGTGRAGGPLAKPATRIFATATASPWMSMKPSSLSKAGCAPSVGRRTTARLGIGRTRCVLTIATPPGRFAGCCATAATSSSEATAHPRSSSGPLATYAPTLDEIVEITPDGVADVYDIQVAETECFIANGLASHNTRWHEDDLSGGLLADSAEEWQVISLPAISDGEGDPLHRPAGTALWPERFPAARLETVEKQLGPKLWSALYQQAPSPGSGGTFQREWFRGATEGPSTYVVARGQVVKKQTCTRLMTLDTAQATHAKADWTVAGVADLTPSNELILLDVRRVRISGPDQPGFVEEIAEEWEPELIGIENKSSGTWLIEELHRRGKLPVLALEANTDKMLRALPAAAKYKAGMVYHLRGAPWVKGFEHELGVFPNGAFDDQVDMVSHMVRLAMRKEMPAGAGSGPKVHGR
jgi:predicted phage terminase large subunit-like protein